MVVSGVQDGKRMIVVVNGLDSELERANEAEKLITYGFRYFETKSFFTKGQEVAADIWQGDSNNVSLIVNEDINLTVNKLNLENIKINIKYDFDHCSN